MYKGYRYVDSDAHILEPAISGKSISTQRSSPRRQATWPVTRTTRRPGSWTYTSENTRCPTSTHPGATDPGNRRGLRGVRPDGFSPETYKTVLDRSGIDYMVVYPTVGLYVVNVPELDTRPRPPTAGPITTGSTTSAQPATGAFSG